MEFLYEWGPSKERLRMGREPVSLIQLTSAHVKAQHACTFQLLTIGTKAAFYFDWSVRN